MYSGNMVWSNMATVAVIAVVIIFTLLPVWPPMAKKILWWISVTFLLITFTFLMIRLILFLLCWICGFEFWIFPRLFDETLGIIESFQPTYVFERGSPGQGYYRIALLLALVGFVGWALSQPTEFDGFIKAQKEFVDDLYSGNLLADVAAHRENLENLERSKRFPKIDQLLREMEEDERENAAASASSTDSGFSNDENELSEESRNALDEDRLDALLNDDEDAGGRTADEEDTNEGTEQEL
jgi:translocation protein SEC62